MRHLVIVESPTKVKTVGKYLGREYDVVASVGHIRDLPKSDKDAVDVEHDFKPKYVVSKEKEKVVDDIAKRAKKVDSVILATDPDREGEAIAWHIQQATGVKNPKRIIFHEITEEAVLEALKHPRSINQELRKSQEARRVLDRLFGYTLSKLIWEKVRYGLSAGRVQSPALRILMEREREIQKFKPETFWELNGTFKRKDGSEHLASCEVTFPEKEKDTVQDILKRAPQESWTVHAVQERLQKRNPRAPFTTSTMQQAANSMLGWSPSYTMRMAQKLYEAGHITYMRTDSTSLSASAHAMIKNRITETYGKQYYKRTIYKTKSKSAQEAHEAIRPSNIANVFCGTTKQEKALYELIYNRTVASQMIPAEFIRKVVSFAAHNIPHFLVRGVSVKELGWCRADEGSCAEEVILPDFAEGEPMTCTQIQEVEKQTTPPPRYSEAGLVKELEGRGIGRPSTYASIIQTLIERKYVEKEQRALVPTDLGDVVSTFIEDNFESYISDSFTATMEQTLDGIAEGKDTYEKTLSDFYFPFKKTVEGKKDIEKLTTLGPAPENLTCPECGAPMDRKLSKTGVFLSCSKFPDCKGARTKDGEEIQPPKEIGKECPKCGAPLVQRTGRYGNFISCQSYPKCKYIEEDPEEKKKRDTGVTCTECKKGTIIERNGRYGPFYGCSEYPDCSYAMKAKPTGAVCPLCSALMMEGTKTIPDRCSIKTCPMHNPHKMEKEG
ncbi:MAG: type I DNA topoisomerase [Candidatus Kaiserbacteria bacterium]|nr:type I DNA topoisomerase [Candidatus Kaiserbacteria bacterium]